MGFYIRNPKVLVSSLFLESGFCLSKNQQLTAPKTPRSSTSGPEAVEVGLAKAKLSGLIPALEPLIQRALKEGVRYHPELVKTLLAAVGE
jgi:hypothetical protein